MSVSPESPRRGRGGRLALLAALFAAACGPTRPAGEPPPRLGQVPDFELVNRDDRPITRADLGGRPWVADFIFTRCALSCPLMTSRMIRLGVSRPGIRRVSFSVDPDYDTPGVLADYADAYGIADPSWLFLTGAREELYSLVRDGFLLGLAEGEAGAAEPITHSTRFVLVDGDGTIRGYYDAFDEESVARLLADHDTLAPPPP